MKKAIISVLAIAGMAMFCGCTGGGNARETQKSADDMGKFGKFEGLSAETEKRILQEYCKIKTKEEGFEWYVNDVWVSDFYGAFNGCFAVNIRDNYPHPDVETYFYEYIGGIMFHCYGGRIPYLWKDGRFYSLQEAYDLGLLAREDLKIIADIINTTDDFE